MPKRNWLARWILVLFASWLGWFAIPAHRTVKLDTGTPYRWPAFLRSSPIPRDHQHSERMRPYAALVL